METVPNFINRATELHRIAEKARNTTPSEKLYDEFIEHATELAKHGMMEATMPIMKKSAFSRMYDAIVSRGMKPDISQDEYVNERYSAQEQCIELLKNNGFTVEIEKQSGIILPGQSQSPDAEHMEAIATIRW